jgi:hypothetical protein
MPIRHARTAAARVDADKRLSPSTLRRYGRRLPAAQATVCWPDKCRRCAADFPAEPRDSAADFRLMMFDFATVIFTKLPHCRYHAAADATPSAV